MKECNQVCFVVCFDAVIGKKKWKGFVSWLNEDKERTTHLQRHGGGSRLLLSRTYDFMSKPDRVVSIRVSAFVCQ